MKFASMLRRLRNTQGGGARSAARSRSTPYTNGPFGPVAHAGSDQTVSVKTKVYFDGSDSTDPDGGNLYYSWAFGAGAKPATGRGVKPSCTYTTTGDKTVRLTVRDTDNNVASDTVDITVIELTLKGPATVTRGEEATYTATVEPNVPNTTFSWQFMNTEGEDRVTIPAEEEITDTWGGQMVVSGIIKVTATVNDIPFTKEKITPVDNRSWSDDFPTLPRPNLGLGGGVLLEYPTEDEHLGRTLISSYRVDVTIKPVGVGPNRGWMFVQFPPISRPWLVHSFVNPALSNPNHRFYQYNTDERHDTENYMALLDENIKYHEGVKELPPLTEECPDPPESHASWAHDHLRENPINPWAEFQVKHNSVHTKAVFKKKVTDMVEELKQNVHTAGDGTPDKPHPDPKHKIPLPDFPTDGYPPGDEE